VEKISNHFDMLDDVVIFTSAEYLYLLTEWINKSKWRNKLYLFLFIVFTSFFFYAFHRPDNLPKDFITPGATSSTHQEQELEPDNEIFLGEAGGLTEASTNEPPVSFMDVVNVVRLMGGYDMAWSMRASGRKYDSPNGFGVLMGGLTGFVLDFSMCNRLCKKCSLGHHPSDHNCRLNYWGSAKGMEAHVAKKLVTESEILKEKKLEVGIFVGDDDSSAIAACREASDHQIVKQSDANHTSKGVKSLLYDISKKHAEMNTETILYLHRCFTYAVAQNKGNSKTMAAAIKSIPHHAFNDHQFCGQWCGYQKDPENYEHRIIIGGFQDENLKCALINIFDKLASNSQKFSAGASSNNNESFNSMMASRCPKSRCYSQSASADYRLSATVGKKNIGHGYSQEVLTKYGLSPGSPFHTQFVSRGDFTSSKRLSLSRLPEFKKKRLAQKKNRAALSHRREAAEGVTYESNVALLSDPGIDDVEPGVGVLDQSLGEGDSLIVFFDLETTGLGADADILQLAAKNKNLTFSTYIKSKKLIPKTATDIHGITISGGDVFKHGVIVPSVHLSPAFSNFLSFLNKLNCKVVLASHNLNFDGPRFVRNLTNLSMVSDFKSVVKGMVCTLTTIKGSTGRKTENSLTSLAAWLNITFSGAHDAVSDVEVLEKIISKLDLYSLLLEKAEDFEKLVQKYDHQAFINKNLILVAPLVGIVGAEIRKRMVAQNITVDSLIGAFQETGEDGVRQLLTIERDGLSAVTKHNPTIKKILTWLQSNSGESTVPDSNSVEHNNAIENSLELENNFADSISIEPNNAIENSVEPENNFANSISVEPNNTIENSLEPDNNLAESSNLSVSNRDLLHEIFDMAGDNLVD
jgi:DNA polymerase III epsilon subunit-like protein